MVGNGFTVITRLVESTATWTSITTVQFGIEDSILLFILSLSFVDEAELFRPVEQKPDHEDLEDFYF